MRKTTRRKWYARSAVTGSLSSALSELKNAIELAGKPPAETPLTASLGKVVKTLNQAIEYEKLYQLGRKRIQRSLEREAKALEQLLEEVRGVPVTQGEKAIAKKEKGGG